LLKLESRRYKEGCGLDPVSTRPKENSEPATCSEHLVKFHQSWAWTFTFGSWGSGLLVLNWVFVSWHLHVPAGSWLSQDRCLAA